MQNLVIMWYYTTCWENFKIFPKLNFLPFLEVTEFLAGFWCFFYRLSLQEPNLVYRNLLNKFCDFVLFWISLHLWRIQRCQMMDSQKNISPLFYLIKFCFFLKNYANETNGMKSKTSVRIVKTAKFWFIFSIFFPHIFVPVVIKLSYKK